SGFPFAPSSRPRVSQNVIITTDRSSATSLCMSSSPKSKGRAAALRIRSDDGSGDAGCAGGFEFGESMCSRLRAAVCPPDVPGESVAKRVGRARPVISRPSRQRYYTDSPVEASKRVAVKEAGNKAAKCRYFPPVFVQGVGVPEKDQGRKPLKQEGLRPSF